MSRFWTFEPEEDGACTPMLRGRLCVRAADWMPLMKGEVERGWQRERDSLALDAM
jgi:hypothetical protein